MEPFWGVPCGECGCPARWTLLVDGGFRQGMAHHREDRLREDPVGDQYDHLSDLSEREELGRHLPRSEGPLLGDPCEDGRPVRTE